MAIDDVIERLAFGTSTPKTSHCLGLFLSPETIYVSETRLEKGRVRVDHLVRIPLPQLDASKTAGGLSTATLNTDFLNDTAKLAAVIKTSMSQIRWGAKDVVVTLSHHLGLLRYFAMPAIDRKYWKSAVPLEAKKYIPVPFDQLSHDFQVAPLAADAANKPRQAALIAVTQKRNLTNVTALLDALGLKLIAMEVAPCSVLRVWDMLDKEGAAQAFGQVHFDGGNIRILLADRGIPVFFRELFLGPQATVNDLRKVDLAGCVAFAQKNLAVGAIGRLRVSGQGTALAQWAEAFGQETGARAEVQDTAAMLGIKAADWGGYAAIGASLRSVASSSMALDLGRVGRVTDEEKRVARDVSVACGTLAALFLVLGLFENALCAVKARQLSHLKRNPQLEAIFAGKSSTQIEQMLDTMQQQVSAGQMFTSASRPKMISLLKDIVDSLPEKVWLTQVTIQPPLQAGAPSAMDNSTLQLSGNASGASVSEEQAMPYQFREALLKTSGVGRLFADLQVTLSGHEMPSDPGRSLSPEELAKSLENRTTFTMTGKPRS